MWTCLELNLSWLSPGQAEYEDIEESHGTMVLESRFLGRICSYYQYQSNNLNISWLVTSAGTRQRIHKTKVDELRIWSIIFHMSSWKRQRKKSPKLWRQGQATHDCSSLKQKLQVTFYGTGETNAVQEEASSSNPEKGPFFKNKRFLGKSYKLHQGFSLARFFNPHVNALIGAERPGEGRASVASATNSNNENSRRTRTNLPLAFHELSRLQQCLSLLFCQLLVDAGAPPVRLLLRRAFHRRLCALLLLPDKSQEIFFLLANHGSVNVFREIRSLGMMPSFIYIIHNWRSTSRVELAACGFLSAVGFITSSFNGIEVLFRRFATLAICPQVGHAFMHVAFSTATGIRKKWHALLVPHIAASLLLRCEKTKFLCANPDPLGVA